MWEALLWTLAALAAIIGGIWKYLDGNGDYWTKRGVDSLKRGELATFWQRITLKVSFIEYDLRCYKRFEGQKYGGLVEFREPVFYVRDLDLIKQILVKDFDHFVDRRKLDFNKHDKLFSKMLVQSAGKEWKDLRSVMSPTFTTGKIKRMFEYFNSCADQFANHLKTLGETEESVEFQDAFGRFTVSVISSIVFGLQSDVFTNEDSYVRKMVKKMQAVSFIRILKILLVFIFPKIGKRFGGTITEPESTKFFESVIRQNIQKRRETGEKRQDFLQIMLEAQAGQVKVDEKEELDKFEKDAQLQDTTTGGSKRDLSVILDDDTVVAQAFLFFSAGLDTMQVMLTFAAYEIALNPEVQERLAEEVIPVMKKNNGALTYEDVHSMEYLDMVVSETLRHHPPAIATERQCTVDYRVPDTDIVITKGQRAMIPINSIHHDEKYYEYPDKFYPEHFSAENKASRNPYAYMPFGHGPRNCIAMRFALTEAKAAIAHLVYNFKIEPSEKTQIPLVRSPKTARPESCWLKFQARRSQD